MFELQTHEALEMPDTTTVANCHRKDPESFFSNASVVCSAHQTQSFPEFFLQVVCIIRPDVRSWRLAPKCLHEAFRFAAHCNAHYERAAAAFWHILNCFKICRLDFFLNIFKCATYFSLQCFFHYYAGREALEEAT